MSKSWIMIKWDLKRYDQIYIQIGHVTINYDEIKINKRTEFPLLTPKGKNAGTLKLLELIIVEPKEE